MPRKAGSVARAPWGTISRERVVAAAVDFVRSSGYEQLTIRALAAEMGVSPMSLYRHVKDKDDLLDEVVDRLQVDSWRPDGSDDDWKGWVIEAADKLRDFLVTQPAALHVYLHHPVVSPSAVARLEAVIAVLRRALGDEQVARRAYAALQTYTIGFAALEASRAGWDPASSRGGEGANDELVRQMLAYTSSRQFVDGLHYLLDGIEREARELASPR